ncbi:hypothetical protein HU200_045458 [Digitaria exilis]|uniref:Uncharacterized protein n=1 Tax=Digitaria exilis TaxID=1010633 RepID=A0A835EFZ2_9POAL|nr:hypothetical protein HU200_045458 [Digitaria exilis]
MGRTSRDQLIVEHDVRGLIYLEACIRKAFWLHTYNPPRIAMVDTTIANVTPKGSQVILSYVGLGWKPRVWQDPLEFHPERHLPAVAAVAAGPAL